MALKIDGRMKVKSLKEAFKKEFGLTLRVYDGRGFADDEATLASIRKKDDIKGGEFSPKRNMKIGNFEDKMMDIFGIKTQIAGSDDSYLCDDDKTLAAAQEADEKLMEKRAKRAEKQKETPEEEDTQEDDSRELLSLDEVIEKIKKEYAGHEDLDEILTDLSDEDYFDHWANKMCDADFPANLEIAKNLYALQEKKCESSRDYLSLAEDIANSDGLHDLEWAKKLFAKAIVYADGAEETINVADAILRTLEDKEWAMKLYIASEKKINGLGEYNSLIGSVLSELDDKEWAKKLAQEAAEKLTGADDMIEFAGYASNILELAKFIAEDLGDKEVTKEIFDLIKQDRGITDLLDAARAVMEIYGDDEYVNSFVEDVLAQAIENVESGYYCDIYHFIKESLEDDARADEFMDEYYDGMREDYEEGYGCEELFEDEDDEVDIDDIDFNEYWDMRALIAIHMRFIEDLILENFDDDNNQISEEGIELANELLDEFVEELKEKLGGNVEENNIKIAFGDDVKDYHSGIIDNSVETEGITLYIVITREVPQEVMDAIFLSFDGDKYSNFGATLLNFENGEILDQTYYNGEHDSSFVIREEGEESDGNFEYRYKHYIEIKEQLEI